MDTDDDSLANLNTLMLSITRLPEPEFDQAILDMAALTLNTLRVRRGPQFVEELVKMSLAQSGTITGIGWQGPGAAH